MLSVQLLTTYIINMGLLLNYTARHSFQHIVGFTYISKLTKLLVAHETVISGLRHII